MLKLAKLNFAIGILMLLVSCKAAESAQRETRSSYEIVIKLQDVGSFTDLMSSAGKIKNPADIQMIECQNYFMFQMRELRIRYDDTTGSIIQRIRNELFRCRGILELSVSKL